jgi:uncharacterized membrane protein (UPF0182 family)
MSRRRTAGYAVGAVLLLLFGGRWAAMRFTEASWYADLGLGAQYWSRLLHDLTWQVATAAAATLWYAAQTGAVYRSIGAVHLPRRVGDLEIAEAVPRRTLRWIALGLALVLGFVTAMTFADIPDLVTLYRHATPLDLREPILGRNASFYLAQLPLLETLHLAALAMVLFGAFVAAALYGLTGSITYAERRLRITPHARTHLVVLAAFLALVLAWGFQLDAYGIVGGGGSAHGALSPADRAIRIPASTALAALALVVAGGTVAALRWTRPTLLLALWVTLAAATILGRFAAPYLSDAWRARPDREVTQALDQLTDRYSRAGAGLLDVASLERLDVRPAVPAESLAALGRELRGLSPWAAEPGLLDAALTAAWPDSARPREWTVTLDRSRGAEADALVAVAVPETDLLALERSPRRPDWTELHRGVLSWAGDPVAVTADGRGASSLTFLGRLDPVADSDLAPVPLERAAGRIRYLAHAVDPAVVGPDEPLARNAPAGLRLGGWVRRLLLAWALQSPPLLDRRTSNADRLLIWRDVPRRLTRLYPFATFDMPRAALVGGRLLWIADGYLASARFPLAEHVIWNGDEVSYLRAPYVATVDAVSGATRLYLRPPALPFAAQLAAGYGTHLLPGDSMSADLRRHLGYPAGLFVAQAEMLARHRGDAGPARPWLVASREPADAAPGGRPQPAVAQVLAAIGVGPARLWRLLPLTDAAGNRVVAFVAGAAQPDGSPWLRLLRLPEGDFPTPAAAESRFSSSPSVVAAVAGAAGPDGAVRRSGVVALPAAGTVAYVQFLFTTLHRSEEPLMPRGAAVLAGGRLGVGDDVSDATGALASVRESRSAELGAASSLSQAREAFVALDSAVRRGDWIEFARAYEALRRALGSGGAKGRRP